MPTFAEIYSHLPCGGVPLPLRLEETLFFVTWAKERPMTLRKFCSMVHPRCCVVQANRLIMFSVPRNVVEHTHEQNSSLEGGRR